MKKFTFSFKSLLLAAGLLVGSANAWAVDYLTTYTGIVGATDNTSGFNTKGSKEMSLQAGDEYVITFVNNNKGASGTDYWENWAFCSNVFNCRADHGASNPYWGDATNVNYTGSSWSDIYSTIQQWLQAYNGVTVTVTVSRNSIGDGITISHTATTNAVDAIASQTYAGTFTATVNSATAINFYMTCEDSHLKITNVHANAGGVEKNYALLDVDHTASSSRNGSNEITTTVDSEYEHYNNTKAAAWGGWAYAQFSYTVPVGYSVESATLTWSTTIGGNTGTRNNDIYYVDTGTSIDYAALTSSTNLNPAATFVVGVSKNGPATHTGITTDVSSAVRTVAETQNYIIFKWTNNAAGANLHGKISANPPTLELVTTAATFYTATFNANDGALNPSVTVYSDAGRTSSIAKDALSANTTYYYTAVLEGYNNYEGSFDVETSDPVVNFTMTAKPRYTFTVNAVNSVGSAVIEAIYTDDDSYDGKTHNVYFPKYLTGVGNIVTFSKDDDTYYQQYTSASGDATKSVSYTTYNGVAYFFEGESYASLGTKMNNGNYSNGRAGRGLNNATMNIATIPVAGTYNITYAICSNNVGTGKETQFSFYKNNSDNVIVDVTNLNHSVTNVKTTGTQTVNSITFAAGDILQFYAKETKIILDYVLVKAATVPVTISAAGYATFSSEYALDLTTANTLAGLTAYYINSSELSTNNAPFTTIDQTVAAGEGILLKGDAGTYNINVVASGTTLPNNALVATDGSAITAGNYVFAYETANPSTTAGFYYVSADTDPVAAGKAYLNGTLVPAGVKSFIFDNTVTGIESAAVSEAEEDGVLYNTSGQQVTKDYKGIVIVNGKKFFNK